MYDRIEEYNPKEKKTFAKFIYRFVDFFLTRRISKGIKKGAIIVPGVVCEAHGCIGINCVTCWGLHIEKHTMMGPNCRFCSIGHKRSEGGPYAFRGFTESHPIYVRKDCWIGYNVVVMGGLLLLMKDVQLVLHRLLQKMFHLFAWPQVTQQ